MSTVSERPVVPAPAELAGAELRSASLRDWVRLARPSQWVKNAFILAPLLFSGHALDPHARIAELGAFAAFCLLASAIYLGNDIVDAAADRAHPVKRNRPIAAGRISPVAAAGVAALLLGGGLFIATLILVVRGGPYQGAHLQLLSVYFPGYRVTLAGSFVGFVYTFVIGYALGRVVGFVYNRLSGVDG